MAEISLQMGRNGTAAERSGCCLPRCTLATAACEGKIWTDDYSSLLALMREELVRNRRRLIR